MDHIYLLVSLGIALAGGIVAALSGARRWLVLASGALAAPAGLSDGLFVPEYWSPVHLLGPWFSLEGMAFSFGNGCLIMALALGRGALPPRPASAVPALLRMSSVMVPGIAVFVIAWRGGGLMIMHAVFVAFLCMFALIWLRRGFSAALSLRGGLGFLPVYVIETLIWYGLDPSFAGFWGNNGAYLIRLPFPPGIPLEEYLWAITYGALWANLIGFGFGCTEPGTLRARA